MPPRYAYWTIIVDDQPTAFRAGALDDIMPTFNRLKEKQPTAKLMWFQSGKLWPSRIDAREAMQVRGERGRYSDPRQDGGDKTPSRERPKWKSKDFNNPKPRATDTKPTERPEWRPKGATGDRPAWKTQPSPGGPFDSSRQKSGVAQDKRPFIGRRSEGHDRPEGKPEWKPKPSGEKPEWKPKGASSERPAWKTKPSPGGRYDSSRQKSGVAQDRRPFTGRRIEGRDRPEGKPEWKPKDGSARPEWKPKSSSPHVPKPSSPEDPAKRKWIPKAEYKKLTGTEAKRDDKWRPGGEHKDPRQKYKDAKKAKWGRFKQAIRSRAKGKKL